MQTNFGNVAKAYAQHRNDLPDELMASLKLRGIHFHGKDVVDLGAGTGVLSRAMSREGSAVTGVEPSAELIAEAKSIDESEDMNINYICNFAESTDLQSAAFDCATVLRAWHWFDRQKTMDEIKRLLQPGGKLLVMDSGFTSKSKIISDTAEIVKSYMPDGKIKPAGSKADASQLIHSFPVEWFEEWKQGGFDLKETYKFNYTVSFSNESWCGRVGSLSWLTNFDEYQKQEVLDKIYTHLTNEFGDVEHHIQHGCYVAILAQS
ncbi:methyltransferase family protein [Salsuginibacillus halophilus]|uniref:Methyltransferase family protein n=1 Tax=Salsuginibacillus halophilus TaxID=517424 RepID=A0A2P8H9V6_9BACI|nr:class I SAM-dependent methyltransferase [Salsuginibacillus halophilus]PSL42981.1 methyltransferase family protein [Salsuginibacillus halophilus]